MEAAKKEVKERRKGRKKKCFTGSSFECDFFFFSQSHTHTHTHTHTQIE
jgi:hypothetical protein